MENKNTYTPEEIFQFIQLYVELRDTRKEYSSISEHLQHQDKNCGEITDHGLELLESLEKKVLGLQERWENEVPQNLRSGLEKI